MRAPDGIIALNKYPLTQTPKNMPTNTLINNTPRPEKRGREAPRAPVKNDLKI